MTDTLIGLADIADLIGLTPNSVKQMSTNGKLPPHDAAANQGRTKLWLTSTIRAWDKAREKRYDNRIDQ